MPQGKNWWITKQKPRRGRSARLRSAGRRSLSSGSAEERPFAQADITKIAQKYTATPQLQNNHRYIIEYLIIDYAT